MASIALSGTYFSGENWGVGEVAFGKSGASKSEGHQMTKASVALHFGTDGAAYTPMRWIKKRSLAVILHESARGLTLFHGRAVLKPHKAC
jgi:hypothetical protein